MHKLVKNLFNTSKIRIKPLIITLLFTACGTTSKSTLDLQSFYKEGKENAIYPSEKQIELLEVIIPKETYQPAPSILNRTYWEKVSTTASGKKYLEIAVSEFKKAPEVPITDSIYRLANKDGNRGIYKPRYYRTMERLEYFVLAECIENKGRFLPQIEVYLKAIISMKSWLHPNHDDNENGVLEGKRVTIDLGARRFGTDLALAEVLLGEKLNESLRNEIKTELQTRIIDSYLRSSETLDKNNTWLKSTSNWNSVCTSGSLFVAIATSKNREERIAAIGSALNSMKYYLSGFGTDGYCSEGAGYWNYGFGHYLYLSQMLHDYSNGAINLFEADNPDKLINVGNFPERYQVHKGICAPFADGVSKVSNDGGFAYNMSAKHYGATMPPAPKETKSHDSFSAVYQLIEWNQNESKINVDSKNQFIKELPNYTYFDDVGMVISRGKQKVPFSIAMKAGHNAENHNHSDVGTYTIVLGKDIITGDIGAPSYRAGSFSPDNKARSSWGHPVPKIDNQLQSNGKNFSGSISSTEFKENSDKVVMDLKSAYEIETLKSLIRTFKNNKKGDGVISIEDEFSATKKVEFGVAIMTLSEYEIINSNTIILIIENQKIKAEVFGLGGQLKITDKLVPVKHLREGASAYRIGVDFTEPVSEGSITIKYTPILK
ncbi:hypothetical protein [Polaribacter vadi]|uniref:hypothetical protein n=1 Tax=Polaribacter vadi TaxID=1774273 RepID=UPI0030EBF3AA|tara:strand:+ start:57266 stop:59245 length:1980 start_codon:yes stop_codon:yes gene_type:complete